MLNESFLVATEVVAGQSQERSPHQQQNGKGTTGAKHFS